MVMCRHTLKIVLSLCGIGIARAVLFGFLSHLNYKWREFVDSCQSHLTTATLRVHRLVGAFSSVSTKVIDR